MAERTTDVSQFLDAARAGSPAALGDVLEACRAYLQSIADGELDGALRAKGGASDLVQETFLEAQRDFRAFRGHSEAELLAWLRRMLLNNLNNFARHYRGTDKRQIDREMVFDPHASSTMAPFQPAADTPTPSAEVAADEETRALDAAVQRLPPDYRDIIVLRYRDECSFEEIARKMNRSVEATRKLWSRAVVKLQQEFE